MGRRLLALSEQRAGLLHRQPRDRQPDGRGHPHRRSRRQPPGHRRAARQHAGVGGKFGHRLRPRQWPGQHHRLQLVRRRQPQPRKARQRLVHPELREHLRPQLAAQGQLHDHARRRTGRHHPHRRRLDHEERLVPRRPQRHFHDEALHRHRLHLRLRAGRGQRHVAVHRAGLRHRKDRPHRGRRLPLRLQQHGHRHVRGP